MLFDFRYDASKKLDGLREGIGNALDRFREENRIYLGGGI